MKLPFKYIAILVIVSLALSLIHILHPLPRVNEIAYDVDDNPKAYYFQQAQNGLYARCLLYTSRCV